MPHPSGGYRNAAGKRIPGVTSITGLFGDKNGIIYAANRLALEPLLEARALLQIAWDTGEDYSPDNLSVARFLDIDPDNWDHKKAWGKAADAGTCAHEMFDTWIKKEPFDETKYPEYIRHLAAPALQAAIEWANQTNFKIIETEVSLVSEKYQFGGTRDACLANGKRSIGDWKTSKSIYPEYLMQIAAYGLLDEEAGNVIDGGYQLLRFSKQEKPTDPVMFSHYYWSQLDLAREAFLLCRRLYDLKADLERMTK